MLEQLIEQYDLSPFTFTRLVRIDAKATPHSHPVLTLSTRFMVRTLDGVIADYLHEQLHWYVASRRTAVRQANAEWRAIFGRVPGKRGGGAGQRRSTLLHLTVNWLEYEALRAVVGAGRAGEVLEGKVEGPIYPWVYRQVRDENETLGRVLQRVGLAQVTTGE